RCDALARRPPVLRVLPLHRVRTAAEGDLLALRRQLRGHGRPGLAVGMEGAGTALVERDGAIHPRDRTLRAAALRARRASLGGLLAQRGVNASTTRSPPPAFSSRCSVPAGTVSSLPLPRRSVSSPARTSASPSSTW